MVGDVCSWGVCVPDPGVVYLVPGVGVSSGGCLLPGGSAPGGVVSQYALKQTCHPPCVKRITDRQV